MQRMTSNNVQEMGVHQLALNQVYIGRDGRARYRDYVRDLSVCDLIRTAAGTLNVELPMLNDSDLSGLMVDFLQYDEEEPEGILAIFYRALCAMAEIRDRLSAYEDTGLEPEEFEAVAVLDESEAMGEIKTLEFPKKEAEVLLAWMREQMYGNTATQWKYGNEHDRMFDCADLIQALVEQAERRIGGSDETD